MSIRIEHHCDRCGKALNPDDPWLRLEVFESEDGVFKRPEGSPWIRGSEGTLDFCFACEQDMVGFMSGKLTHDFLKRGERT